MYQWETVKKDAFHKRPVDEMYFPLEDEGHDCVPFLLVEDHPGGKRGVLKKERLGPIANGILKTG
jgi:hypothetical protein